MLYKNQLVFIKVGLLAISHAHSSFVLVESELGYSVIILLERGKKLGVFLKLSRLCSFHVSKAKQHVCLCVCVGGQQSADIML